MNDRWARNWARLHATLNAVREAFPDATEVDLETSDQGSYGFVLNRIRAEVTIATGAEVPGELGDVIDAELCDVDWDSVVGESREGYATVGLATRTVYALYVGQYPTHELKLDTWGPDRSAADSAWSEYRRRRDIRVRLLQLDIPADWDDAFTVRHLTGMRSHKTNDLGVTVVADNALPFRIDGDGDLAGVEEAFTLYLREHPEIMEASNLEYVAPGGPRNVRRAHHTLDALSTYADAVGDDEEPLEATVGDFLGDLLHLMELLDPNGEHTFDSILDRARRRFVEELAGE